MNKESFLVFLGILIVVLFGVSIHYMSSGVKNLERDNTEPDNAIVDNQTPVTTDEEETDSEEEIEYGNSDIKEYNFKNTYGDGEKETTIEAKKCETLKGFAGAASNVFYIDWENKLHYLELGYLEDKVIATNIVDFEVDFDGLTAYYTDTYSKVLDNDYVTYKKK